MALFNGRDLTSGSNGAASCKTWAGGAGVAMIIGSDMAAGFRWLIYLGDVQFPVPQKLPRGLVKIAIIQVAVPRNRNQCPAHQPVNRAGIESG